MGLKTLFLILSVLLSLGATSCRSGLHVKVYYLDADQGGLIRKQSNEVLSFKEAQGYYCVSPSDLEVILQVCKQGAQK